MIIGDLNAEVEDIAGLAVEIQQAEFFDVGDMKAANSVHWLSMVACRQPTTYGFNCQIP